MLHSTPHCDRNLCNTTLSMPAVSGFHAEHCTGTIMNDPQQQQIGRYQVLDDLLCNYFPTSWSLINFFTGTQALVVASCSLSLSLLAILQHMYTNRPNCQSDRHANHSPHAFREAWSKVCRVKDCRIVLVFAKKKRKKKKKTPWRGSIFTYG